MGVASIVTDAKVGEILSSFSFPVPEREREAAESQTQQQNLRRKFSD